jgi:hypothetical protein
MEDHLRYVEPERPASQEVAVSHLSASVLAGVVAILQLGWPP